MNHRTLALVSANQIISSVKISDDTEIHYEAWVSKGTDPLDFMKI